VREHARAYEALRTLVAERPDSAAGNRPLGEALQHIDRHYVVARNDRGVVVVDARRACRRVAAARLAVALEDASIVPRPLLVPVTVSVNESQADLLEGREALLERLGFDFRRVAQTSVSCRGVPAPLATAAPQELVLCVADALANTQADTLADTLAHSDPAVESTHDFPALLDAVLEKCDLTAGWSWDRDTMNDLLRQLERLQAASHMQESESIWCQLGAEDMAALLERPRS
jgi:DNA mismatch repair ATPase MutL